MLSSSSSLPYPGLCTLWCVFFFFLNYLLFWLCQVLVVAQGICRCGLWALSCSLWDLVPWPGIEPRPSALGMRSLSHWTTREVPVFFKHPASTHSYLSYFSRIKVNSFIHPIVIDNPVQGARNTVENKRDTDAYSPGSGLWWPSFPHASVSSL